MYYFNLSFMSYRDWRIQHCMSHHLYPNSLHDLEVTSFEPFLCWIPKPSKNCVQRYASWIYSPIIYSTIFIHHYLQRYRQLLLILRKLSANDFDFFRLIFCFVKTKNLFRVYDLIPFTLPFAMYLFGCNDLGIVFRTWMLIVFMGSFFFGLIGLNAGHHNIYNVHEGDTLRQVDFSCVDETFYLNKYYVKLNSFSINMDWGIYCLDTVVDNSNISHNHLISLTHFGNHLMHHLLPTIDHGIAAQLYSVLFDTMADFETEFEEYPWFVHITGQLRQLAKNSPASVTPAERKIMRIKENSR